MSGPPLTVPAQPAPACSSGRIVRNRLTTAPGPDPVPPAAQLRASTVNAGHPVAVSTAACGQRFGGGPAHDRLFTNLVRPPGTDRRSAATPHFAPGLTPRKSMRAEQRACMRWPRRVPPLRLKWRSPHARNWRCFFPGARQLVRDKRRNT
jgi:hypothetical protein